MSINLVLFAFSWKYQPHPCPLSSQNLNIEQRNSPGWRGVIFERGLRPLSVTYSPFFCGRSIVYIHGAERERDISVNAVQSFFRCGVSTSNIRTESSM
jgi:hypothetical protein